MPTLQELRAQNEAIEQQMHDWRQQRFANGENPLDWVAFRTHVRQLGAPDPGELPPDEFYRWGEELHGGQPDATAETQGPHPAEPDRLSGLQISEVNSLRAGPNAPNAPNAGGDTATWPSDAGSGSATSHWAKPKTER